MMILACFLCFCSPITLKCLFFSSSLVMYLCFFLARCIKGSFYLLHNGKFDALEVPFRCHTNYV
ncbi:hypothetical protein IC582_025009 [Cucumis melo]